MEGLREDFCTNLERYYFIEDILCDVDEVFIECMNP